MNDDDVRYARLSLLARFMSNPGRSHWDAAKQVLRYGKGTKDIKLTYGIEETGFNRIYRCGLGVTEE